MTLDLAALAQHHDILNDAILFRRARRPLDQERLASESELGALNILLFDENFQSAQELLTGGGNELLMVAPVEERPNSLESSHLHGALGLVQQVQQLIEDACNLKIDLTRGSNHGDGTQGRLTSKLSVEFLAQDLEHLINLSL